MTKKSTFDYLDNPDPCNPVKLKANHIPEAKERIMRKEQGYVCPLCGINLMAIQQKFRCLDHDHSKTGSNAGGVRGVLCISCNGMEGKINTSVTRARKGMPKPEYLRRLADYWEKHDTNQTGLIHPNHGKVQKRKKKSSEGTPKITPSNW